MTYQDKSIQCSDCGNTFTFGVQEQEQFASRGYTHDPGRCPTCRQARRAQQSGNGGNSYNSPNSYSSGSYSNRSYNSAPRQMFAIKCSTCGKDAQVPFEPRNGRPVYCSDCYRKTNPVKRYQLLADNDWLGRAVQLDSPTQPFSSRRIFTGNSQSVQYIQHCHYY